MTKLLSKMKTAQIQTEYRPIVISKTNQEISTLQESAQSLMQFLNTNSVEVAINLPMQYQMSVMEIQVSRSFDICRVATKVFQMPQESSLKLTCAVISLFNKSVKVSTEKMNGLEIYETAAMFCEKYTHESISDLMLCLKMVKSGALGIVYNRFDTVTLFEFFAKYLEQKYSILESEVKKQKSITDGSVNTEYQRDTQQLERKKKKKEDDDNWKQAIEVIDLKYQNGVYQ